MQKRTREIIALILLIVLGLGIVCAMGWYILVGHNWNVAASNIDDSIGQMRGYTVFLAKGNKPLPQEDVINGDATGEDEQPQANDSQEVQPVSQAAGEGVPNNSFNSNTSENSDNDALNPTTVENAEGEPIRTVTELIEEYQDKGAEVFVLESAEESAYSKPVIINSATQTIGVFKVDSPTRPAAVKVETKLLNRANTDFNILVTADPNLEGTALKDVDIIVFNATNDSYSNGRYGANSYCVDTPYEGEVAAIIVSPSGVISSKVITL